MMDFRQLSPPWKTSLSQPGVQETLGLLPGVLLIHLAMPHLYACLSGFRLDVPSCKREKLLIERTTQILIIYPSEIQKPSWILPHSSQEDDLSTISAS